MAELLHYDLDPGATIAVEVDDEDSGFEEASPRDYPAQAAKSFTAALD